MTSVECKSELTTIAKWKITEFSKAAARDDPKKRLRSDRFKLGMSEIQCRFLFLPTSVSDNYKNYSAVLLCVNGFGGLPTIHLHYKFWLENEDNEKIGERENEKDFVGPKSDRWGFGDFVHHDDLYLMDNKFVKDDIVYVCCKITHGNKMPIESPKSEVEFRQSLLSACKRGHTGECYFEVEGKKIKLSKTVLAAQSDVFNAMFGQGTTQSETGEIKITDFAAGAIQAFVDYSHSGRVDDMEKHAEELFKLGNKYNIEALQNQCSKHFADSLTDDNISERLILAFRHNDAHLKTAAIEYIVKSGDNKLFMKVLGTKDWGKFLTEHDALAQEIMDGVTVKMFSKMK